jgi:hypothetical protein
MEVFMRSVKHDKARRRIFENAPKQDNERHFFFLICLLLYCELLVNSRYSSVILSSVS